MNPPDRAAVPLPEVRRNIELLGHIVIGGLIGFLAHRISYNWLQDNFTERSSRLGAYAIGYLIDIPSSWLIMRGYEKNTQANTERRKSPAVRFEMYLITRIIAGLALGAGVVLGYFLDNE